MIKLLVVAGILIALLLVALTSEIDIDTPNPSFAVSSDGLQPLSVISCVPDAGYDYCYTSSYVFAEVEIHYTNWQGETGYGYIDGAYRPYYLDEIYMNIKMTEGDYLYKSTASSWMPCSTSGCSGTQISNGKHILATAPAKTWPGTHFAIWDKSYSSSGAWYAVWMWTGWLGTQNTYVIDCYDNDDCSVNEYCDKSGEWDTWSCKMDPCLTMPEAEDICDGFNLWSQKCLHGEYVKDQLISSNSPLCGCYLYTESIPDTCIGFDLWSQKQDTTCVEGLVTDKLLETDSNKCGCVIQETPNTCIGTVLWSQKQAVPCLEGLFLDEIIEENSIECGYICTEGETITFICTDDTEIITQQCINNQFVPVIGRLVPAVQLCPLNWVNLEIILNSYIEEIKSMIEELL